MNSEDLIKWLDIRDEALVRTPAWYNEVVEGVRTLLNEDFNKLVYVLYRVDVSEQKLRSVLKGNPGTDAAILIANLLLERQLQKIQHLQQFKGENAFEDDAEKW